MENETTKIPFDGIGRDPQSLVGRKIQYSYRAGKPIPLLVFKFTDGKAQFVNPGDLDSLEDGHDSEEHGGRTLFKMDDCLEETLDALRGDRNRTLVILEACVGKRITESQSHKVIGIRCEGTRKMGFIYCVTEGAYNFDDDDSDGYEYWTLYHDVILAARRIKY